MTQPIPSFESVVSAINIAIMRNDLNKAQQLCAFAHEHFDATDETQWKRLRTEPLEAAAGYGRIDILQYLLPYSSLETVDALHYAMTSKEWEAFNLLTPHYSALQLEQVASSAAQFNHWSAIPFLIPLLKHSTGQLEEILARASAQQRDVTMKALYPLCNAEEALQWGRENDLSPDDLNLLMVHHSSEEQRKRLTRAVGDVGSERPKSKM